jgi:hypothetical protein
MPALPPSDIRAAIKAAADTFFGRTIYVEERVYQAFMVATNMYGAPHETHIWRQLCLVMPSMSTLHDMINSDFDYTAHGSGWPLRPFKILDSTTYVQHPTWWMPTFLRIFGVRRGEDEKHEYTAAALEVILTGRLTVDNLVLSLLECGQYSVRFGRRNVNAVTRRLADASGVSSVKKWNKEIEDFTNDVATAFRRLRACDSSLGDQQFVLSLDGKRAQLTPFGSFGAYQFHDLRLSDGSLWVARSNVLQPSSTFAPEALAELEDLISSSAGEAAFQRFFERHDEFLLTLGEYVKIHPQLILHEDNGDRLVPDFFLERIDDDNCDICDLKLPSAELVRKQHHRHRFRDAVMEGVAQLLTYRDWFDESSHREKFRSRYRLSAFRPRVVLVIGRRRSFYDDIDRIRLESSLPACVQLKTYDDIVARARQWRLLADRTKSGSSA